MILNSLISIIVVTYNSSAFIIETLESVSNQTWKELEIIISDDCSIDNTVEVCCKWLRDNGKRFVSSKILISETNTGVPANVNRGLYSAKGDWINFLAGDDTLKQDCVKDNMSWIESHPDTKVLFSQVDVYDNTFDPRNFLKTIPDDPYNPNSIMALGRSAESQYKMLLLSDRIHYTPSAFLHRETLLSLGGYDERFKLLEDYPLWLNMTRHGHKLHFLNKVTVNYRRHSKAINNTGLEYLVNPNYFNLEDFRKVYTYPFLPADIRLYQRFNWYASQIFRFKWFNRNKKPNRLLLSFLISYLNPIKYYIYLKKILDKDIGKDEFYS
jgi:glycosyltransferase involved in cell wall biosynthesis